MRRFIIEHKTRGVFMDADHNADLIYMPHFSWSKPRSEGYIFFSFESAQKELKKWPEQRAKNCAIVELRLKLMSKRART